MQKFLSCACAVLVLCAAARASEYSNWKADNADANDRLVKLLKDHPNFRGALNGVANQNLSGLQLYVEFLSEKGDRNTGDFIDKYPKESKGIKRLHENYPDQVKALRETIRDHPKSTKALFSSEAIVDGVIAAAEGREEAQKSEKKSKKKRKDD